MTAVDLLLVATLLAALAAMDQQMNCEEQQGKEHPV